MKTKTLEEKLALEFMESSSKEKKNKKETIKTWNNYVDFYLNDKGANPILYKVLNKRYNEYLEGGRNGKYKKDNN